MLMMMMMPRLSMLVLVLTAMRAAPAADALAADPPDAKEVDFATQIRPIFAARCYACHGPEKQKGKLRLDRRADVFKGPQQEWVIKPEAPQASRLYQLITLPAGDDDIMPAEGDPLTDEQIHLIRDWIQQGAPWPQESDATEPAGEDPFKLPPLDEAQRRAEAASLAALRERGVFVKRVAATTIGLQVNFSPMGDRAGDADLKLLKGLEPTLVWLNLAGTQVTDAGLAAVRGFDRLRRLHLERTGVGDAALAHVALLADLEYLNLYGTSVTIAGLEKLVGIEHLGRLYIGQTPAAAAVPKRSVLAPTLPKWLKLSVTPDGTVVLSGTPGQDDVGEHAVVLQVRDEGGATGQQSFTVRVARPNRPPVFTSKPVVDAMEGATYTYAIQTADPDDPLSRLQARLKGVAINTGSTPSNPLQARATDQPSAP